MERVLQISAQMAGGAGPHQQGSKEIAQLGQSGQSRLDFIGAAIDEGIDAWETQLFDAAVNYADTDFVAQVDTDTPNLEHVIEEMGFTIRHKGKEKTMIAGSWKKLQLRDFARVGEGQTKETDRDAGQAIANVVAAVAAQKDLHEKIGATNLLQLLEYAARLMGAPKSFKLRETTEKKKEGVDEGTQEAIQAAIKSVMQAVDQKVAQPVAKEMQQAQGEITQMQQQLQQLQKLAQLAQALVDRQNLKAKESQTKEQIAQQEAQAEEARKNTAFQAEEQRKNEQSQARIQRENAAAAAELELRKAQEARTETEHQAGIARGHVETSAALARKQAETEAKVDAAKTIASAKADMAKTPESA
jgi:paraquat-inducible protein B